MSKHPPFYQGSGLGRRRIDTILRLLRDIGSGYENRHSFFGGREYLLV
jgi:hypothetical protein